MDANKRQDLLRDRSWMNYKNANDRRRPEYENGVNAFLDFAFSNVGNNEKIRCPCVSCYLGTFHDRKVVFYHLLARGIAQDYNPWTQHGEDEIEDERTPTDNCMLNTHEEHVPKSNPYIGNYVRHSREEKVKGGEMCHGEKKKRDVYQEKNEDGDSPVIPTNVWEYVCAIGMSKTDAGGDVYQENDDDDDDNGDRDVSMGEDNNFIGVNDCDSSPNQSSEDMDFAATEDEQAAGEGDLSETAHAANSGNRKKNVYRRWPRGLIRNKEIEKSTERVKVELPANVGRVVGSNARKFIVESNWLLKRTLRPDVEKWKDLDPNDVAKLLEKVKNRFIFPNESHVDTALLWQFKQWFRHWRADLRRAYFNQDDTYEEQLANRPSYVEVAHWKWLVDYWNSEKFKNMSSTNSRIRQNLKSIACGGPVSVARYAYELEKTQSKQDSECPAYLKLFEKQKRRLDGTWIHKEAEGGYKELVKLHKKQVENHGIDNLTPSEAFNIVFGEATAINLVGIGENPIALVNSSKCKRKGCSDRKIIEAAAVRSRVEIESEKTLADREYPIALEKSSKRKRKDSSDRRIIEAAAARSRVETESEKTRADRENPVAFENGSKRTRKGSSDRRIIEAAAARSRAETEFEKTWADGENPTALENISKRTQKGSSDRRIIQVAAARSGVETESEKTRADRENSIAFENISKRTRKGSSDRRIIEAAAARSRAETESEKTWSDGENPIALENISKRARKGSSDRRIIEVAAARSGVETESEKTRADRENSIALENISKRTRKGSSDRRIIEAAAARSRVESESEKTRADRENPIALESISKRTRKGCSDRRIIEAAAVRSRVESESEKTRADREAQSEENQSVRESLIQAEISEQIRLIREGLATSSSNA